MIGYRGPYFKVVNENENYTKYGYGGNKIIQFNDGLNILDGDFYLPYHTDSDEFVFSNINYIFEYVKNPNDSIRVVYIPDNANFMNTNKNEKYYRSDKIFFGKKISMNDLCIDEFLKEYYDENGIHGVLSYYAKINDNKIVKYLIDNKIVDHRINDYEIYDALLNCVKNKNKEMMRLIIEKCNVDLENNSNEIYEALLCCIDNNNKYMMEFIINTCDIKFEDNEIYDAYIYCVKNKNNEMIKFIVNKFNVNLDNLSFTDEILENHGFHRYT